MDTTKYALVIDSLEKKINTLSELLPTLQVGQFLELVLTVAAGQGIELIDDLSEQGIMRCKLHFIVQEDAQLNYLMKSIDSDELLPEQAEIIEREITVTLAGRNAQAEVKCLCLGRGNKVYKFKTIQDHQAEAATSNVVIKSVLDDQAQLFCKGLIHIQKTAQRTAADLLNKNILLSRKAQATSIPMLEVLADDVRCSHGAAISKLDDEHFFYLQSRGLTRDDSCQLLIDAFLT